MKMKKCVLAVSLVLAMSFGLTACGNSGTEQAAALVQGNLDEIYLGRVTEDYLKLIDGTKEESAQAYLDGLEVEAEYFVNYWGIVESDYGETYANLDEDFQNEVIEMYKEIYSYSKYEVQEAVKQDDDSYSVKVIISPIDIMEQAEDLYLNDEYEPLNAFWTKYAEYDFSTMSDEDYMAYTHEYGRVIVQMMYDLLPNIGYMDEKSMVLQVETIDGVMSINDDDFGIFDSYVISYP